MRLLRGLAGVLLWVVALLLAIVGAVLCVTLILLPLGLPVLRYARKLFTLSLRLMFPGTAHRSTAAAEKVRSLAGGDGS